MESVKTVLVTGASGFVGGHLVRRLVKEGYRVRALVRNKDQAEAVSGMKAEPVLGDLLDAGSLRIATKGVDTVYHIAALFRPENVTRKNMMDVNAEGTRSMLEASIASGVKRFVHCSTIGVHGDIKHPPATEDCPYAPGDTYQESKVKGEKIALSYMKEGRLPIVVFRPGGLYGPGDLRFLKLFKAVKKRRFVMLGSGRVLYQMGYIDDVVDGIVLCGTRETAPGRIYILTGEPPVTLDELVKTIAEVLEVPAPRMRMPVWPVYLAGMLCEWIFKPLGLNPPLYRRRVDFFIKSRSFDISKAKRELGYHPRVDLATGLRLTADWYLRNGLL